MKQSNGITNGVKEKLSKLNIVVWGKDLLLTSVGKNFHQKADSLLKVVVMTFVLFFMMLDYSWAGGGGQSIQNFLTKTARLLQNTAIIIGPGLGLLFCLAGIMKIRKKEEDPRQFGSGILYIIAGVGCAVVGAFISWVMDYYGVSTSAIQQTPVW